MSTVTDFETEGVTEFATQTSASYRYVISLKSEKVNIWLEDRSSKKQWQTGFLSKEEYVTAANAFVDASAADYISCFEQCLNCSVDETDESQRKLTTIKGGGLQLEMGIKLRLLQSSREISYVFHLQPVAVERIDILESKLKDQQEELEQLRGQIGNPDPAFLCAESVQCVASKLQWNPLNSPYFELNEDMTSITVLLPGLYAFGALVNHMPNANNSVGFIAFQKNGAEIQRAATGAANARGYYVSHATSASLMCLLRVEENETITIACNKTLVIADAPSYLTAVRIGV